MASPISSNSALYQNGIENLLLNCIQNKQLESYNKMQKIIAKLKILTNDPDCQRLANTLQSLMIQNSKGPIRTEDLD